MSEPVVWGFDGFHSVCYRSLRSVGSQLWPRQPLIEDQEMARRLQSTAVLNIGSVLIHVHSTMLKQNQIAGNHWPEHACNMTWLTDPVTGCPHPKTR